jgi:DNA topoisomerase VI subunit A
MYYRDPVLFSNQHVVDRYVDDIARTFGVRRALLNVVRVDSSISRAVC